MRIFLAVVFAFGLGAAFAEMEPATPESQGVDSQGILDFIAAAEKQFDGVNGGALHGFVVVRHGKTVAEGSWKPFDTLNETHMLYSHSKSFTSTAIGLLVDTGRLDLDERLVDIFPEDVPANPDPRLDEIRVRDLLTMNVGADRDHVIGRAEKDWSKEFMKKTLPRRPGTGFKYDSDATYMLAAIVERRSGEKLMDFLKSRLFDPLGIKNAWTTTSPEGIACGGWGMNMTTREIARFGQLYLQEGVWEGKRILSAEWCRLATARHTWSGWRDVGVKSLGDGSDWEQGYGFLFWRCHHGAYRADGAAGQFTVVVPEKDLVVSINAGLADMQKELDLIWNILLPACKDEPLPDSAELNLKLGDRLAGLTIAPCYNSLDGMFSPGKYVLKENPRGFKSVEFVPIVGGEILCRLETRAGMQEFPAGLGKWTKGKVRIDPESYERLGAYIGEHAVSASCAVEKDGTIHVRAYLTGDTGHLDFKVPKDGRLTGEFWAMGGCSFESVIR